MNYDAQLTARNLVQAALEATRAGVRNFSIEKGVGSRIVRDLAEAIINIDENLIEEGDHGNY